MAQADSSQNKGRIPREFIDELLARADIVEVIDARVPLRKAGREYKACCPFHNEKTPSFTVSQDKQFYYCFGCGASGTALSFLMNYEHLSFVESVEELANRVGLQVPREAAIDPSRPKYDELYDLLEQCARFYRGQLRKHPDAKQAVDYLKQRGLSGEIANTFELGYAPSGWDNLLNQLGNTPKNQQLLLEAGMVIRGNKERPYDRFRQRIMFPIRDQRGRVIGFGGRVLPGAAADQEGAKYLNSPETAIFHKNQELYGLYQAKQHARQQGYTLVVEGYMDVVALAQHGINYAVATLGTATTHEHLERLFRVTSNIYFCFDGDRAGRSAAGRALERALPHMSAGRQIGFVFLPEGEDPDSLVRKEGKELFEQRIAKHLSFSRFFYEYLSQQDDMGSNEGRANLINKATPLVEKIPEGPLKHLVLDQLSKASLVDSHQLEQLIQQKNNKNNYDAKKNRTPGVDQRLTPVKQAIALVLQHPSLAQNIDNLDELRKIELRGSRMLLNLLELIKSSPHVSCGAIIETWPDQREQQFLIQLAQREFTLSEDGLQAELTGALKRIRELDKEQRTERLLQKSRQGGLDEAEKKQLQQLLS